jgi:alpha-galactosidase
MIKPKISIIGAGSSNFSLELVRDICLTPNLSGSTISFMDINEERLSQVLSLCRRYAEEMGMDLKLEKTMQRRESLKDADFVINLALVVGHLGYTKVWKIARKYGYKFGGSYHVMHDEGFWINYYQLELFEAIVKNILEICPNALLVELANPVLAATTFLCRKYPKLKYVGLCEGPRAIYNMAEAFGLDPDKISYQMPGVNHFVWLTDFRHEGEDAYPKLDNWIKKKAKSYWKTRPPSDILGPVAIDLYKKFGVYPIGDTCTPGGGSWPWWYHTDSTVEKSWGEDPNNWWDRYLGHLSESGGYYSKLLRSSDKLTDTLSPVKSRQPTVPMIEAVACDIPRVIQVNILNSGNFLEGVPNDFEVEISGLASGRGIEGVRMKPLPKSLIEYILRDRVAPVETELEAYEKGNRQKLQELIMMDPWTRSESQASGLLDDVLALPEYSKMKKHYS